jgi:hypothetical protein
MQFMMRVTPAKYEAAPSGPSPDAAGVKTVTLYNEALQKAPMGDTEIIEARLAQGLDDLPEEIKEGLGDLERGDPAIWSRGRRGC